MSFLHPALLYGLVAIAIPIIIHLFDFRRTKKVYFSSTRLLHQVKESTQSFYNLKHFLILLSRILFVAALVVAFAQPFLIPRGGAGLVSNKVGLFIDNSQSMSNDVDQDESGLEMAKEVAKEFIDLYPASTAFIVQTAFDEKSLYMYMSRQEAKNYIGSLEITSEYRSLANIIANFSHTIDERPPNEIVLLSDFQRSTLMSANLHPDSTSHLIVLPVTFATYNNLAIDTAYISNPFEINKSKRNLLVRVNNYSPEEVSNVPVRIFANDRQLSVNAVTIPAKEQVEINFNIGNDLMNKQKGEIILDDFPVSFDNNLFFTLDETEKINILQISGKKPSQYIAAVFGNEKLFNFSSTPATNIDYNHFSEADLIVLNQINSLDANLTLRLAEYQASGGSILVAPAETQILNSYQILLPRLNEANLDESAVALQTPDFSRPFFKNILEKNQTNLTMPEVRAVWKWGSDRNALLKFIDGRPYLSEVSPRLYVLASPLSEAYSGFQTNALFVPIMYRLAANSKQNLSPLFYRLNEQELKLRVDEIQPNDIFKLSMAGKEYIPDQRIRGRNIILALPGSAMQPGHYDLVKGDVSISSLALNLETTESDLTPFTGEELSSAFAGFDFTMINGVNQQEIITKITNEYKGIELWRYFLALALLFLLVEALLIRLL